MRPYLATYRLPSGTQGTLHLLARNSIDATCLAIDAIGELVASLRVSPA